MVHANKAAVGLLLVAILCSSAYSGHARKTLAAYDHQSDGTADDSVRFFTSGKFTGSVWPFSVGWSQSQLKKLNLRGETVSKNDMYSSAKVGADAYATIYEHSDYKGDHTDMHHPGHLREHILPPQRQGQQPEGQGAARERHRCLRQGDRRRHPAERPCRLHVRPLPELQLYELQAPPR